MGTDDSSAVMVPGTSLGDDSAKAVKAMQTGGDNSVMLRKMKLRMKKMKLRMKKCERRLNNVEKQLIELESRNEEVGSVFY
ncbi:hypothetical protein Mapa_016556 [Marchantia paleacea]|nr:hypothetical protein Mapa_016556 [Marchantia paleacea]